MKSIRLALIFMTGALLAVGLGGPASAETFHRGGVGHCDGCHTMHDLTTSGELLKGSDPSSTCLNCHEGNGGYRVASADSTKVNYSAGGDFYWLQNDYAVDFGDGPIILSGDNFGHNIIADDFSYDSDVTLSSAPGGTYPARNLHCTSCHDAHGQVLGGAGAPISGSGSYGADWPTDGSILGNYRLLGDSAYTVDWPRKGAYSFSRGAPVAAAENNEPDGYFSEQVHYGSGMSEWCANCHNSLLTGTADGLIHPAGNDVHLTDYFENYNRYHTTGIYEAYGSANYDGLVPIEKGMTDVTLTNTLAPTSTGTAITFGSIAATSTFNVMCLTCHRAHASGNPNIGRWDFTTEILADHWAKNVISGYPLTDHNAPHYYGGTSIDIAVRYSAYQRPLCNKCHVQD